MNVDVFAEWLRRQGHRVVRTESSSWFNIATGVYQAFPFHHLIEPKSDELNDLFRQNHALGLRYSSPLSAPVGRLSYHVIFNQPAYPLASLSKKARHDVQKGMQTAYFEPVSFRRLGKDGWHMRFDTLKRQGRMRAETQAWWQNLCQAADGLPGFEAWAAVVNGQLAASLIAFTSADCCSILYQQSHTEYLSLGVNNALTFVFTNEVLRQSENLWVFYGLHSLDAPASVDQFKFRMGYQARPVRQRVVFHPLFQPFVNPLSYAALHAGRRLSPGSPTLAKAEGFFRFYLHGRLPLSQQAPPAPLQENFTTPGQEA